MNLRNGIYALTFCASLAQAQTQVINEDWRFCKSEQTSPSSLSSATGWTTVNLPHTWNAEDGQDGGLGYHGGGVYYRGTGWYTKEIRFNRKDSDKQIILRFGAANYDMELFVNGQPAGTHKGGYTAFAFDITPFIRFGENNGIAVRVSNAANLPIPPLHADFTFYGGLPRGMEILRENKIHITNEDFGSHGVYIKQESVSDTEASVAVTTKVCNRSRKDSRISVSVTIKDRNGNIVKEDIRQVKINAGEITPVTQRFTIANPHLWNGTEDPYLYRTEIKVSAGKKVLDSEVQPLGLRYYRIDPDKGFFLNGQAYPLRGVAMHEGRMDKGNALTDNERKADLDMVKEIGANYVRISHYQHGDFTYNYLDSLGIMCWTEIPLIDYIIDSEEFTANCETVLKSLIRQLYNHPSVIVWGLSNEITFYKGPDPLPLTKRLNDLAHSEDPTRPTVLAAMHHEKDVNFIPDAYSINPYYGWYYGKAEDIGPVLDRLHQKYPKACIGISEYGAGAHPFHQQEGLYVPATTGHWHPENGQAHFHEVHWEAIKQRPYLWSTSIWAMFDFASDNRHEGNQPGINDKGLVTFDRKIKKDAFYFYKANWNPSPMVHICGKRFTKRDTECTAVKIYSNCDNVKLTVNGKEVPLQKGKNAVYLSETITLSKGENKISTVAYKDGKEYKDNTVWYYVPLKQTIPGAE